MTKLFNQLDDSERPAEVQWVVKRWEQLYALNREATSSVFNFLFLTNTGGAAAVLGFIGASKAATTSLPVTLALLCFALGVILVGVLKSLYFHQTLCLVTGWANDSKSYFASKITEDVLKSNDDRRVNSWQYKAQFIAGYCAFGCFVAGLISAAFGFFPKG
jgi:hypothetical protein